MTGTKTLTDQKIIDLVTSQGYNRSVYRLTGDKANLATAKRIVESLAAEAMEALA